MTASDIKQVAQEVNDMKKVQGEIIATQSTISGKIELINQREQFSAQERNNIMQAIDWIRANMATKDDMAHRLRAIEGVETDLKSHVKETNVAITALKESQTRSINEVKDSFTSSFDKFKAEIMPQINKGAQAAGDGLIKNAALTGKFTIAYGILYLIIAGIVGGAIGLFYGRVE